MAERLAAGWLAAEGLAAERLVAERLAAEEFVAERLAAGRLAAERLAAEKTCESTLIRRGRWRCESEDRERKVEPAGLSCHPNIISRRLILPPKYPQPPAYPATQISSPRRLILPSNCLDQFSQSVSSVSSVQSVQSVSSVSSVSQLPHAEQITGCARKKTTR